MSNIENAEEENEKLRKVIKTLKKQLDYYQSHYYILEKNSKKIQENKIIKKFSNISNNNLSKDKNYDTSNLFYSPYEFKEKWQEFAGNQLINNFDSFDNNKDYVFLTNLIQEIALVTYNETKNEINKKIIGIKNILNIDNKDKINISYIINLLRPNFLNSFPLTEELIINIKKKIYENCKIFNNYLIYEENLKKSIEEKQFVDLLKHLFEICLFMLLQEKPLNFNISNYSNRKLQYMFYNKNTMINLDGFQKEEKNKTVCIK